MKVQLEFEKHDLEEMLTLYFERSGFAIKNLPQLCEQFASAFPEGIKVQAEIIPHFEPRAAGDSPAPSYLAADEFDGESEETVVDAVEAGPEPEPELTFEVVEDPRLTHADLMDPSRPVPGNETKDMAEILSLVRKSKALESMR